DREHGRPSRGVHNHAAGSSGLISAIPARKGRTRRLEQTSHKSHSEPRFHNSLSPSAGLRAQSGGRGRDRLWIRRSSPFLLPSESEWERGFETTSSQNRSLRSPDRELDALGQGEVVPPVDGAGLAAHVGFPGIGARFTATTGFFLAAEGSAD